MYAPRDRCLARNFKVPAGTLNPLGALIGLAPAYRLLPVFAFPCASRGQLALFGTPRAPPIGGFPYGPQRPIGRFRHGPRFRLGPSGDGVGSKLYSPTLGPCRPCRATPSAATHSGAAPRLGVHAKAEPRLAVPGQTLPDPSMPRLAVGCRTRPRAGVGWGVGVRLFLAAPLAPSHGHWARWQG